MPIFQNYLPDNKLRRDRIFSVRVLVTHDSHHVGDCIRSCQRNFCRKSEVRQRMQILFLNLFTMRVNEMNLTYWPTDLRAEMLPPTYRSRLNGTSSALPAMKCPL